MSANWDPAHLAPDPDDIVTCVGCGLCLPHCPTFRLTGRETASPRGRIAAMRAVDEGDATVDAAFTRMMDECLACRACEAACPSGVPFGRMIESARAQAESGRPLPARLLKRAALAGVLPRRRLIMAGAWLAGLARVSRLDRLAPPRLRAGMPAVSLRELVRPVPRSVGGGPTAMVLTGCVMDAAFRPAQRATMELIARAGMRAVRPAPGGCCGALAMHYGHPEAARAMARARVAEWQGAEVIVVNASGCSAHVKGYADLLRDDPEWAARAATVAARTFDVLELEPAGGPAGARSLGPVAVHEACHHIHAQGLSPRGMLRAAGARCVEVADADRCCGAAGLYSVLQPELSARLRRQKAEAVAAAGAPVVAVANPGCAIQIAAGLREIDSRVRVAHPAELVAHPERFGEA